MRTRHRIPTIFNLSMVDVLCCALGCVILMWLLNFREAKRRAEDAGQTATRLAAVTKDADALRARLLAAENEARSTADQLASARTDADVRTKERDAARRDLEQARSRITDLDRDLAQRDQMLTALRAENADAADRLAKKNKELDKERTTARRRISDLEMLVREKETLASAASPSADDLSDRLRDAEARTKQLRAQADLIPGLRDDVKDYRDKLTTAEARAKALEINLDDEKKKLTAAGRSMDDLDESKRKLTSDLATARRRIDDLEENRRSLTDQVGRARAAAENRFAGIELIGRRVVFLVDMSGSMEMVDENTAAPDKWTGVRETLAKIMRSLPNLEKFQVILFSKDATYLLGAGDGFIPFDAKSSVDRVTKALAAVKPKGNTNMYAAFAAAFRHRAEGLDTIYVLSDGLPNIGAGLTEEAARNMKETEKAEILGNHVRKTLKTDWNRELRDRPRVRINAVGFFYESPDVGAFLWALARENDGSFVGMSKP